MTHRTGNEYTRSRGETASRSMLTIFAAASGKKLFRAAMWTPATRFLKLLPTHSWPPGCGFCHRDAAWHRANQRAQVAAHALLFQHHGDVLGQAAMAQIAIRTLFYADALVRAIFASNVAEVATYAFCCVNLGDDFVVQIEIAPVVNARDRLADDLGN